MPSSTEICNLALAHVGSSKLITSLTEKSDEARACNQFFDQTRQEVLREFPWHFTTRFQELALIEEQPTNEWGFSYGYPSDALTIRRILSGIRRDTIESRARFRVVRGESSQVIFTDTVDACAEYTVNETDAGRFPVDFVNALSWKIALYIAPRLTEGDPFKVMREIQRGYVAAIGIAVSSFANERGEDRKPESESITIREGIIGAEGTRQSFLDFFLP